MNIFIIYKLVKCDIMKLSEVYWKIGRFCGNELNRRNDKDDNYFENNCMITL